MAATLIGIRTHDNYRSIWYSTYPELETATVHAGLNNLSMHFGLQNDTASTILRRGVLNYKNPDSPTGYTNLFDYPADIPPGEFHNFEITTDMLNRDMEFSFTWLAPSPNNPHVWHVEDYFNFTVFTYNPNPPPNGNGNGYTTKEECEAAGYFWYDNACHFNPYVPPNGFPDVGTLVLIAGVITLGIGVAWYFWKGR